MEFEIIEAIEVELKYCERCGGLWLRQRGAAEVYCHICGPKMAEFPEARKNWSHPHSQ
jgi:Zn-finger nucleic acid-binding protein